MLFRLKKNIFFVIQVDEGEFFLGESVGFEMLFQSSYDSDNINFDVEQ